MSELRLLIESEAQSEPILFLYTVGGPDHRLTVLKVQLSLIALFLSLDLDYVCAARTAPYHSWCRAIANITIDKFCRAESGKKESITILVPKHKTQTTGTAMVTARGPNLQNLRTFFQYLRPLFPKSCNPVERIMSIVNLGLQCVGLEMDDKNERLAARAGNMKEIRSLLAKHPGFEKAVLNSVGSAEIRKPSRGYS